MSKQACYILHTFRMLVLKRYLESVMFSRYNVVSHYDPVDQLQ